MFMLFYITIYSTIEEDVIMLDIVGISTLFLMVLDFIIVIRTSTVDQNEN